METIDANVTVTSTVIFPDATDRWLSQSLDFSKLDDKRLFVTRGYWASYLGVKYITLKRWEDNIIKESFVLGYQYYDSNKRNGRHGLDLYQRFLLKLIRDMKMGNAPFTKVMTYQEIIKFMEDNSSGQAWWVGISRTEFNKNQATRTQKVG